MVLIPNSHLSLKSWSINLLISVQPKQMNKHAEYNTDMLMVRYLYSFPLNDWRHWNQKVLKYK